MIAVWQCAVAQQSERVASYFRPRINPVFAYTEAYRVLVNQNVEWWVLEKEIFSQVPNPAQPQSEKTKVWGP